MDYCEKRWSKNPDMQENSAFVKIIASTTWEAIPSSLIFPRKNGLGLINTHLF